MTPADEMQLQTQIQTQMQLQIQMQIQMQLWKQMQMVDVIPTNIKQIVDHNLWARLMKCNCKHKYKYKCSYKYKCKYKNNTDGWCNTNQHQIDCKPQYMSRALPLKYNLLLHLDIVLAILQIVLLDCSSPHEVQCICAMGQRRALP